MVYSAQSMKLVLDTLDSTPLTYEELQKKTKIHMGTLRNIVREHLNADSLRDVYFTPRRISAKYKAEELFGGLSKKSLIYKPKNEGLLARRILVELPLNTDGRFKTSRNLRLRDILPKEAFGIVKAYQAAEKEAFYYATMIAAQRAANYLEIETPELVAKFIW
jgi:hypothetical protein